MPRSSLLGDCGDRAIVTSGTWESDEARQAGFAAAKEAGVDFAYDDRQLRPWDVFHLSPV